MTDNITNVHLPANTWIDLYAATDIAVGQPLVVENVGVYDIYLAVQETEPEKKHTAYNILKRDDDIRLTNNLGDAGAWAFCNTSIGSISVAERDGFQPLLKSALHDGFGNPIGSFDGAINVHASDLHRIVVNDYIHAHGVGTTLAASADAGDISINVVSAVAFSIGNYVHLGTIPAPTEPVHPRITDIISNEIFLDRPIDFNYILGDAITLSIVDLTTSIGTLVAPIRYRYFPKAGRFEHIVQIILSMDHSANGADDLFGSIGALLNGVVFRAQISGQLGAFTNWKTNGDIKLDVGPERVIYSVKSGPGDFGTSARGSFSDIGIAIRLDESAGDFLEMLVQDDLNGLTNFRIKVQGHVETQ